MAKFFGINVLKWRNAIRNHARLHLDEQKRFIWKLSNEIKLSPLRAKVAIDEFKLLFLLKVLERFLLSEFSERLIVWHLSLSLR